MISSCEQTSHRYLDEVADDTNDEELLTEEDETDTIGQSHLRFHTKNGSGLLNIAPMESISHRGHLTKL